MNQLEIKMVDILKELKDSYHAVAVKSEFETEGATLTEARLLKDLASHIGLDYTLKIGGCGALKDLYNAKQIGVNSIVAPMIESPYSAEKFLQSAKIVFSDVEREKIKFLINIETKYGVDSLDEILESDFANEISGIVMGRTDLVCSLKMDKEAVDSPIIMQYANIIAQKALNHNKELIIGGGVNKHSLDFFRTISPRAVNKYETRKIIFDAQKSLALVDCEQGLLKAFEFELLWLKNKQNINTILTDEDSKRIKMLEGYLDIARSL